MLNVKIYCPITYPEYETTYQIVNEVLHEHNLNYIIERVSKMEELYRLRILYPPQIVINNRVVFSRRCPQKDEILQILHKMHLIKSNNQASIHIKQ